MTVQLFNLARMVTLTKGTGTVTLSTAVAPFLTFAQAGVPNGATVRYAAIDGIAGSEIGSGVYNSTAKTLTRTVTNSTNNNLPISLSGAGAQVFITAAAEDFQDAIDTQFASVAAVQAAIIPSSVTFFILAGFYTPGDGGAALYFRVNSQPSTPGGKIQSADGAWWQIGAGQYNLKMFGAKGDNAHDDTTAVNNWIAQAVASYSVSPVPRAASRLYAPAGAYALSSTIAVPNTVPLDFVGDGGQSTIFQNTAISNEAIFTISGTTSPNCLISFRYCGFNEVTSGSPAQIGLNFAGAANTSLGLVTVDNCYFFGQIYATSFINTFGFKVTNCYFDHIKKTCIYAHDTSANAALIAGNYFFTTSNGTGFNGAAVDIANASALRITGNNSTGNYNTYALGTGIYGLIFESNYDENGAIGGPGGLVISGDNFGWSFKGNSWGGENGVSSYQMTWDNVTDWTLESEVFNGTTITWRSNAKLVRILNRSKLLSGAVVPNPAGVFSTLPAADATNFGQVYPITDSTTVILGTTITGSGSNKVLAVSNGSNWVVGSTNAAIGNITVDASPNSHLAYYSASQQISPNPYAVLNGGTLSLGLSSAAQQGDIFLIGGTSGNVQLTTPAAAGSQIVYFTGTGNSTLSFPGTTSTYTYPGFSGTLATLAGTETLSNKTMVAPVLGAATATSINGLTITGGATGNVLTILGNKTVKFNNSLEFVSTDGTVMTFPTTSATIARTDASQTFTGAQTFSSTIVGSINGNAATVTTNANLTGDVTSSGNATTLASSISGAKAFSTSLAIGGATIGSNALAVTGTVSISGNTSFNSGAVNIITTGNGGIYFNSNGLQLASSVASDLNVTAADVRLINSTSKIRINDDVALNRQGVSIFGIGASGALTGTGGSLSLATLTAGTNIVGPGTGLTGTAASLTVGNINATSNTTLTSLANLVTVGTVTSGTWSAGAVTSSGNINTSGGYLSANPVSGAANLFLNPQTTTQQAVASFQANGSTKWQIGMQGSGASYGFFFYDATRGADVVDIAVNGNMALMPSGGTVGVGQSGATSGDLFTVNGRIGTNVTLTTGVKVQARYFPMNINGTVVNVLTD